MFALKAAGRLTNASSQLSTRSTILRYLSTEPSAQDGPVNPHEAQSKERSRSIRKVSEEGGAHSQLIALAVKNTAARAAGGQGQGAVSRDQRLAQAKRQLERRKNQQQQGQSNSSSPRNNNRERSRQPRSGGKGGGGESSASSPDAALALLRGNAQQRLFNPRFNSSPLNNNSRFPSSGGPRPPRRNSPGGSSSASPSSPKSKGPRNKSPRQYKSSSSSSSSVFSAEDTKPLVPPPQVSYPSINLAQLLRADLAAKTLQVRRSVDTTTGQSNGGEDSEDPKVREQTRKVLNGDYSQWSQVGGRGGGDKKKGGGGDGALEHAKDLLSRNPSVGLKGREVFINKLKEVL